MSASLDATAAAVEARLQQAGIALTMGGEPTLVPIDPCGAEWTVAADGPTKLSYARAMAEQLQRRAWPDSVALFCPGKLYDGELNPRWALRLVCSSSDEPLVRWRDRADGMGTSPTAEGVLQLLADLASSLECPLHPLQLRDPLDPGRLVWAIPLAWDGERWHSLQWRLPERWRELNRASGPAGLRLPLEHFPEEALRQLLTVEVGDDGWGVFLPPVPRLPFEQLLRALAHHGRRWSRPELSGMLPLDIGNHWKVLGLASDPGVLEVNLPVCSTWAEYAAWLALLEQAGAAVGLRAFKQSGDRRLGTGGGNHLLMGGPDLDRHPFFSRPGWLVGVLRYWQHHPCLAYLFSGASVGPASQAPRLDEGSASLLDLELAHRLLEDLPPGDHRVAIGETLRHLHADRSGNTHRSEISLDKFWNPAWSAGCQGLLEFRALETMPDHRWAARVALLWRALVVMLLDPHCRPQALRDWGPALQDRCMLPSQLWQDLTLVLGDLAAAGLALEPELFEPIWDWRCPLLLSWQQGEARLEIRQALEPWPLLCDVPVEGGSTSRFVDSSLRRFELITTAAFRQGFALLLQGRQLPLDHGNDQPLAVRYRHEALYPCLHPCLPVQLPLELDLRRRGDGSPIARWRLQARSQRFFAVPTPPAAPSGPVRDPLPVLRAAAPGGCTVDLRL
ncbi:MAG: hypothetical protein RLZZ336_356 [Cyanobacteriota bacterium]